MECGSTHTRIIYYSLPMLSCCQTSQEQVYSGDDHASVFTGTYVRTYLWRRDFRDSGASRIEYIRGGI